MKRKREEEEQQREVVASPPPSSPPPQAAAMHALEADAVEQTARLAMHLYLEPFSVLCTCAYWLSQYSDYEVAHERECFHSLVSGLLRHRPRLHLCGSLGIGPPAFNILPFQGELQFAGGDGHRVPLEYVARCRGTRVIESLAALVRPRAECFLVRCADGLDGELELGGFAHDAVLARFYEPSFLVITLYALHLLALAHATGSESEADWLVRHLFSLRAIAPEARLSCLDRSEPEEWAEKEARTREDLARLRAALDTNEVERAKRAVLELWCEKASDCYANMMRYVEEGGADSADDEEEEPGGEKSKLSH